MISPSTPADEYGELQRLVEDVYKVFNLFCFVVTES